MAGAMYINIVDNSQEICYPIHPGITNWKKIFIPLRAESVAGFVGAPSAPSVVFVPSCAVCAVLRDGAKWRRWQAQRHNRAMRSQCFMPTSQKHSLSLLVSPARTSRQRQTRRPRLLFSVSAKYLHERQQQEEAAATGGSNNSRRQQQQQEAAAAGGGSSSSSRRKQQAEAAAATGGSSSSRRKQ